MLITLQQQQKNPGLQDELWQHCKYPHRSKFELIDNRVQAQVLTFEVTDKKFITYLHMKYNL